MRHSFQRRESRAQSRIDDTMYKVGNADAQFGVPIPEPSTALLLASDLIGLAIDGRRRRV